MNKNELELIIREIIKDYLPRKREGEARTFSYKNKKEPVIALIQYICNDESNILASERLDILDLFPSILCDINFYGSHLHLGKTKNKSSDDRFKNLSNFLSFHAKDHENTRCISMADFFREAHKQHSLDPLLTLKKFMKLIANNKKYKHWNLI